MVGLKVPYSVSKRVVDLTVPCSVFKYFAVGLKVPCSVSSYFVHRLKVSCSYLRCLVGPQFAHSWEGLLYIADTALVF